MSSVVATRVDGGQFLTAWVGAVHVLPILQLRPCVIKTLSRSSGMCLMCIVDELEVSYCDEYRTQRSFCTTVS